MSTDLRAIMRRDERRRRMIRDPELTGDALLFALALDEVIATRKERARRSFDHWIDQVYELARGCPNSQDLGRYWVKRVLADDVPRYEPDRGGKAHACVAPMIRREGLCGKRGSRLLVDRDPDTGEGRWIGLCARHRDMEAKFEARRKAWIANGKPSPPANKGGVLRTYFTTDWAELYRWAAPYREPLEGAREMTPPRPSLKLVHGGAEQLGEGS